MFVKIEKACINNIRSLLTLISPSLNVWVNYFLKFKKPLNFKHPTTFIEKLQILKLKYINHPLVIQCADKYQVRQYITKCGYPQILNKLIGCYDVPEQIPWEDLPNRFVLKLNFAAGFNILCRDKNKLDKNHVYKQLHHWDKQKPWLSHAELQYAKVPHKILCEEFLEEDQKTVSLTDYKVYCFNGEPRAILVMHDRAKQIKAEFFDVRWNFLGLPMHSHYLAPDALPNKPKQLEQLLEISRVLSKPFPFVRCDFYIVKDRIIFGEMTFTPSAGLYTSEIDVDGKTMGELLDISTF